VGLDPTLPIGDVPAGVQDVSIGTAITSTASCGHDPYSVQDVAGLPIRNGEEVTTEVHEIRLAPELEDQFGRPRLPRVHHLASDCNPDLELLPTS